MSNTVVNDISSYSLEGATKMKQLTLCFCISVYFCSFLQRCGLATIKPSNLSVRPSNAWIVTKRKQLAKKFNSDE